MLKFIGTGSAFNTKAGNTSAFIRKQDSLLLIDCGGTVFHRLMEANLLTGLQGLRIIITHTHPDHVGSLGDLIFFAHHILKIQPRVYFPEAKRLNTLLNCLGVEDSMYRLMGDMEVAEYDTGLGGFKLAFAPVSHLPGIQAFGVYLEHAGKRIFYSGDSNQLAEGVVDQLRDCSLDMLYQDTSGLDYSGNVHLSFQKLCQEVPQELRRKVCCIHHDGFLDLDQVRGAGFQVAEGYSA